MSEDAGVHLTPWLATSLAPIAAAVTIQAHWLGWVTRLAVGPLGPQLLCRRGAVCIQRAWRSCKLHLSTCACSCLGLHVILARSNFNGCIHSGHISYCFTYSNSTVQIFVLFWQIYRFPLMLLAIVHLTFQIKSEGCFSKSMWYHLIDITNVDAYDSGILVFCWFL